MLWKDAFSAKGMTQMNPAINMDREQLAKALFEAQRHALLETIKTIKFDCDEIRLFLLSLKSESDRALAIVSLAYIDDKMQELMSSAFVKDSPVALGKLFDGFGPLANFASRLRIAAALGWISKETYAALESLRKIRNEFAHRPFISSYDDPEIARLVDSMDPQEKALADFAAHGRSYKPLNRREAFYLRIGLILFRVLGELATAPIALRMMLPPFAALGGNKDIPKPLHDLSLAVVDGISASLNEFVSRP